MNKEEIIKVDNIYFRYSNEGEWALQDVSFPIYKGEWLAIVGHNGSGKSTLAKILNGLLMHEKGSVLLKELN